MAPTSDAEATEQKKIPRAEKALIFTRGNCTQFRRDAIVDTDGLLSSRCKMGGRRDVVFDSGAFMKAPSSFAKIFIHRDPVDMRRGINGLCDLVFSSNMGDLKGANLFVFMGKRRHLIKVLYFDKSGFCLWQKRLEEARFAWPKKMLEDVVLMTPEQFTWLLEGYDPWKMKPFSEVHFERVG